MADKKETSKTITYRTKDADELMKLEEIADAYGVSRSDLIRQAVMRLVKDANEKGTLTLLPKIDRKGSGSG